MNAVDTNILIYVHDPRDPRKQAIAVQLLKSLVSPVLLWQVACEYVAASRKLKQVGVTPQEIWDNLKIMQAAWPLVLPQWKHLALAAILMQRHSLSFWDALLIAVASEEGVTTLYSENFTGLPTIGGLTIVNPFAP
jgi:predicted nucleic acid-binding protein